MSKEMKSIASNLTILTVVFTVWAFYNIGQDAYLHYKVKQAEWAVERLADDALEVRRREARENNCKYWTVTQPDPEKAKLYCD